MTTLDKSEIIETFEQFLKNCKEHQKPDFYKNKTTEELQQGLMELDRETLIEMIIYFSKNYEKKIKQYLKILNQ